MNGISLRIFTAMFCFGLCASNEGLAQIPSFKAKETFVYYLNPSSTEKKFTVKNIFVDLFDTSGSKISTYKKEGKKVICYFSAGSAENWRSDYKDFPKEALGKNLDGWEGERWLDIKNSDVLQVHLKRMNLAKTKGCDGVDPDNLDAYESNGKKTGFTIKKSDSLSFIRKLAAEAHARNLAIGLKNSPELSSSLAKELDWIVIEECHKYNECAAYSEFTKQKKAVFQIEYSSYSSKLCNAAKKYSASLIFADLNLTGKFSACPSY